MKHTPLAALLALAATAFLGACSTLMPEPPAAPWPPTAGSASPSPSPLASGLDGSAWTMALPTGAAGNLETLPTLRFDAGRISGSDGCNRFSGSYTSAPGQLQFGSERIGTRMACPAEDGAQMARAVDGALSATRGYRIDAGKLVLLDAAGAPLMRFDAQTTALAGTAWNVNSVNNGNEAVVSPLNGTMLMLAFGHNNKLMGFGGCNNFSGPYRSEGDALSIGEMFNTRLACEQPEGVMAQEAQFLRALATVTTVQREGHRVELRTASGALAVALQLSSVPTP